MKILYISPENTVGTLSLWKKAHEARGNQCDFITLYKTPNNFDAGHCLELPLISTNKYYLKYRHKYYQAKYGDKGSFIEKDGYPPIWKPNSIIEKLYFRFRDWLWHFKVEKAIKEFDLLNYDIYHFEWGLEFYRDGRFVRKISDSGKHIVCGYHGQDLRNRGVIETIDKLSDLNITSELDLFDKHPNLKYLFLPFDTKQFSPNYNVGQKIRICHAPTNRYFKGSENIIPICEQIARDNNNVEFVLIENAPIEKTLHIKQSCDILIDQVGNRGGWGYGMNSVEALSMGLVCVTELVPKYIDFIPDHPFVNVTAKTLYSTLKDLINNKQQIIDTKKRGRAWVIEHHDMHNTAKQLYKYYDELKWL